MIERDVPICVAGICPVAMRDGDRVFDAFTDYHSAQPFASGLQPGCLFGRQMSGKSYVY